MATRNIKQKSNNLKNTSSIGEYALNNFSQCQRSQSNINKTDFIDFTQSQTNRTKHTNLVPQGSGDYGKHKSVSNSSYLIHSSKSQNNIYSYYEKEKERSYGLERKLDEQRNNQQRKELMNLHSKVSMSNTSREGLRRKEEREHSINNIPSYSKTDRINLNETLKLKHIINEEINITNNLTQRNNRHFNKLQFDKFIKSNDNMILKKKREINGMKQIQIQTTTDACSFNPKINKNSEKLYNNMIHSNYTPTKVMIRSKSFIKKEYNKGKDAYPFNPKTNTKNKKNNITPCKYNKNINYNKCGTSRSPIKYIVQSKKKINTRNVSDNTNKKKNKKVSYTVYNDPFSSLYKINVNQNLPGQIPETIIIK